MGLDAPLALLALLAGALPFLAHRIRRRDLPVIKLPTLALLVATSKKQRSRRDLGDLLLLIVRTALILLAALALAGPYLLTQVAFGDGQISSAMIVLDDSMSMRRGEPDDSLLDEAITRADRAIAALPQGSEVGIVLAGTPARLLTELTDDLIEARKALQTVTPADRATDLSQATALALQQLRGAHGERRRMLVLSDFAASAGPLELEGAEGVEARFERLGSGADEGNFFFAGLSATKDPLQKGNLAIAVTIQRSGGTIAEPGVLHARGGDGAEAELPIRFDGDVARLNLSVKKPSRGQDPVIHLFIEAEDALQADNHAEVLVDREGALRVLLVNGDPHPGTQRDELFYARKALSLLPRDRDPLRVRSVDAATLRHEDLTQCDVLVLANVAAPSDKVAKRIATFVNGGGGLLIAAGDAVDKAAYNGLMGALLPGHISARSDAKGLTFDKAQNVNPFLPTGLSGLREVTFDGHLLIDTQEPALLRFADGSAAVSQRAVGDGQVVLFASSLDDGWTDLPLRPGYIPLLTSLLKLAAGARGTFAETYNPGEPVRIPVPSGAQVMEVVGPDGETKRFALPSEKTIEYTTTQLAGGYRVAAGEGHSALGFVPALSFRVLSSREESQLQAGALPALPDSPTGDRTGASVSQSRSSFSPYLLMLAGILLIAEAALRRRGPMRLRKSTPHENP